LSTPKELLGLKDEGPRAWEETIVAQAAGRGPVIKVLTPAGDEAWLVTRHAEIRKLLLDRRLGRSHPDPANAPLLFKNPMLEWRMSSGYATELEDHTRMRTLLKPYFSGRSMDALRPRLVPIVDKAVAQFAALQPPVDIHTQFAEKLTARVLGELIGVPAQDQAGLPVFAHELAGLDDVQHAAMEQRTFYGYMLELAAAKRAAPADDVLSGLLQNGCREDYAAAIGLTLFFAGFGSTSSHLTLGVAQIGSDPVLRDRLIADPGLMKTAVEELLRTAKDTGPIFPHYARDDIEIGDVTIRAGDLVLLNYGLGNFDQRAFAAPAEVDITRSPNPHLTFAHGMWYCAGAPLAQMFLAMTLNALLATLPALRPAEPAPGAAAPPAAAPGAADPETTGMLVTW
jgi:cytochrome P450 monooxygenase